MASRTVTDHENGTCSLHISFEDEGIKKSTGEYLSGTILVDGDESKANGYAPFFEADLRRCNAKLFPVPEPEEMPEMDEDFGGGNDGD